MPFIKGHKLNIGNTWNKGRKHSEEHKNKVGNALRSREDIVENCKRAAQIRWEGHIKVDKKAKKYKYRQKYNGEYYNKEKHRLEMREWRFKNRDKDRFMKHKRKMLKKNAQGLHTLQEWLLLKKLYNYMCLCCKRTEPEITLTEDHIIPLSLGGKDSLENIQPLCGSCNTRKYTKTINYRPMDNFKDYSNIRVERFGD